MQSTGGGGQKLRTGSLVLPVTDNILTDCMLPLLSISQNPDIFGNSGNASIFSTMPAKMTGIVRFVSFPAYAMNNKQNRGKIHSLKMLSATGITFIKYLCTQKNGGQFYFPADMVQVFTYHSPRLALLVQTFT